jgi:hypothetical protein
VRAHVGEGCGGIQLSSSCPVAFSRRWSDVGLPGPVIEEAIRQQQAQVVTGNEFRRKDDDEEDVLESSGKCCFV